MCVLLVVQSVEAEVIFRDVEATGHGGDESSATLEALQSALSMVGGMKLSTRVAMTVSETVRDDKVNFKQDYSQDIERITRGVVKSYRVVQRGVSPGSGQNFVTIVAKIPTYRPSEQLKRLKLAVEPMTIHPSLGKDSNARKFADDVSSAVEAYLSQSRKFAMLDRRYGRQTDKELHPIISGATPIEDTVKLGMTAGADYVVLVALRDFSVQIAEGRSLLGRPVTRTTAPVSIDVRVIDIATGQIKFAQAYVHLGRLPPNMGLNQHAVDIGAEIGESINAAIFPIAVVAVNDATVTLNQGGGTVQVGRRYRLVILGRNLVDPYTKESLGQEEREIAQIEVISVTDRTAVGRVISGNPNEVKGQLLARPQPDDLLAEKDAPGSVGAPLPSLPNGSGKRPESSNSKSDDW